MITSILFKSMRRVDLDNYDRFEYDGEKLSNKDIPLVRYRFGDLDSEKVEYISLMKEKFNHSCHIVELDLDKNIEKNIEFARENMDGVALLVYLDVTDEMVLGESVGGENKVLLKKLEDMGFDRFGFKDKSVTLNEAILLKLKREVADILDIGVEEIGICESPLSFNGGSCLSAVRARDLMSEYVESNNVALPTQNHEDMTDDGCIRYIVIDTDIIYADLGQVAKIKDTVKKREEKKEVIKKKKKGIVMLEF